MTTNSIGRARRPTRSARRLTLAAIAVLASLTACGLEPEATPRDLPEDERELDVSAQGGDAPIGQARVYFIAPGEDRLLRSVQRDADSGSELIQTLLRGPNEQEAQAEFGTAIPATTELVDEPSISGGNLIVNLTSDIDELDTPALMQAVAQIVYTATELPDVQGVRIYIDGQLLTVPTPDGNTTNRPVQIYDFPNAVVSSQPAFPAAPLTGAT